SSIPSDVSNLEPQSGLRSAERLSWQLALRCGLPRGPESEGSGGPAVLTPTALATKSSNRSARGRHGARGTGDPRSRTDAAAGQVPRAAGYLLPVRGDAGRSSAAARLVSEPGEEPARRGANALAWPAGPPRLDAARCPDCGPLGRGCRARRGAGSVGHGHGQSRTADCGGPGEGRRRPCERGRARGGRNEIAFVDETKGGGAAGRGSLRARCRRGRYGPAGIDRQRAGSAASGPAQVGGEEGRAEVAEREAATHRPLRRSAAGGGDGAAGNNAIPARQRRYVGVRLRW